MTRRPWQRRARGLSMVEILVGLALGLMLVTGVADMVGGSRQTSRVERSLLEMQSTGRNASEVIARELRKAGFRSDRDRSVADLFPVATAPFLTAGGVVAGAASNSEVSVRLQGSGDAFTADCLGNPVAEGQILWQTLSLVGNELRCRTRNMTTNTDQTLAMTAQIEAISVSFGEDTSGDGFADVYRAHAAVADWSRVASINVQLRVMSAEDGVADAAQAYLDFTGTAVTPGDRRLRRTYSSVVALRNLLP